MFLVCIIYSIGLVTKIICILLTMNITKILKDAKLSPCCVVMNGTVGNDSFYIDPFVRKFLHQIFLQTYNTYSIMLYQVVQFVAPYCKKNQIRLLALLLATLLLLITAILHITFMFYNA